MNDKNLWNQPGIPHKGWECVEMIDLGPDSQEDCQMCGKENIRYVHVMKHENYGKILDVGCICAGKMTNDYEGSRQRDQAFRNKISRRNKWLVREWRISRKGNPFLNLRNHNVGCHQTKNGEWGFRIDEDFSNKTYATLDDAKLALFDYFWEAE